jgi:segregation and condensation protein B
LRGRAEAGYTVFTMLTPPAALEALLFAAGEPMEKKELEKLLGLSKDKLEKALEGLKMALEGHGIACIDSGEEVEIRTAPEAADIVKKLRESELSKDLGKAGLETLAVIAYRNGSTRSEIDWVRGVNSSTSLRNLLLRGLVEGEEDPTDRRRIRYGITPDALAHLGIKNSKELPRYDELSEKAEVVAASEEKES